MTRSAAGKQAKRAGSDLELTLALHHSLALSAGIAAIRKVEPPVRRIRTLKGGQFVAVYSAKSGCDFRGCLKGGRAVAIEAKSTAESTLAWSEFTPAERADIDECATLGGLALVLWRGAGVLHAIPWVEMPWRAAGSGRGISAASCVAWRVGVAPYLGRFV